MNLTEFWRRWHITLSHWLRDYLYSPLGGNRRGDRRTKLHRSPAWPASRPLLYFLVSVDALLLASRGAEQFIYFQF